MRALATEALDAGKPVAWFEALYREAGGDPSKVPWADLAPNPALAAWTRRPAALRGVSRAVVVGCGLGHDAECLAARGIDVVAFDVSPTAIRWAKRIHPGTDVRYEVANLLALPSRWRGAFDLVVEVHTLQALPASHRGRAAKAIVSLVAPKGRVFVFTRVRGDGPGVPPLDERTSGPPWPLGRREVVALLAPLRRVGRLVEVADPRDPAIVRAHGVWKRARP